MALQSSKEFSTEIIQMLNVEEAEFDYDIYSKTVRLYTVGLLAEMLDRAGPKITTERETSLMREYCQRFDSAVHRIEQAQTKIKPQFPLFKGAVFVRFIHAVKETTKDPAGAVRRIKEIAAGLPYTEDNPVIRVMLDDLSGVVRKASVETTAEAMRKITNILDEAKDKSSFYKAIETCQAMISKSDGDQGRLQFHAMFEIGRAARRLEVRFQ